MDENSELTKLALKRFTTLTDGEKTLLENLHAGKPADFRVGNEETDNPKNADEWDDKRTIRAEVIAWLCKNKDAIAQMQNNGLEVVGVKIIGKLDLNFVDIPFGLNCANCSFNDEINLQHAIVLGLNLDGTYTRSIKADGTHFKSYVFLRNNFNSDGEVRLIGATIGGDLNCINGHFKNEKKDGCSLNADGIKVGGSVFLRDGFQSYGAVHLIGATIGGDLDCINGHFKNQDKDGIAIGADGIKVEGVAYFRDDFSADGLVSFTGARFDKTFVWTNVKEPAKAKLDLRQACIGTLWDDEKSLPNHKNLFLQGLEYSSIYHKAPYNAKQRIEWIRRQYPEDPEKWSKANYSPQPYEQLASVLRKQGHEKYARDVLIAKEDDRRICNRTKMGLLERAWYWILSFTIRYGYKPERALVIGFAITLIGWWLYSSGVVIPIDASYSPVLIPFIYSLDTFLPVVNLHQLNYFLPDPDAIGVCIFFWFQIIAGWVLTTLFLGGLTGLIRK